MPTPADERLLELLEKWLKSLELHAKYAGLDSDSYWKVQPWPEHQRPSRWIIDLAAQKAAALKAQVHERIAQGDTKFSDSLELMTFLANLIGSEHIERFIPLADAANERELERSAEAKAEADAQAAAPSRCQAARRERRRASGRIHRHHERYARDAEVRCREAAGAEACSRTRRPGQPHRHARNAAARRRETARAAAREHGARHAYRTARRRAGAGAAPRPNNLLKSRPPEVPTPRATQVIADAVRLVQWGRKWYELAELIARMADRPPLPEVRRILKDNKTAIEKKAGGG